MHYNVRPFLRLPFPIVVVQHDGRDFPGPSFQNPLPSVLPIFPSFYGPVDHFISYTVRTSTYSVHGTRVTTLKVDETTSCPSKPLIWKRPGTGGTSGGSRVEEWTSGNHTDPLRIRRPITTASLPVSSPSSTTTDFRRHASTKAPGDDDETLSYESAVDRTSGPWGALPSFENPLDR